MAKRKFNQKARALPPAPMKMYFAVPVTEGGDSSSYISISHSASRLCRRFYRQGLNWAVANMKIIQYPASAAAVGSVCYVNSLPHTWSCANAWVKAYHAWKNQQDNSIELMGAESAVARYRDFKISMEVDHTVGVDLSPVTMGPGRFIGPIPTTGPFVGGGVEASEEWAASQVVIPNDGGVAGNTVEYSLHMVGPSDANSKGVIAGYEFSRSFPQSPDPATPAIETSWLNRLQDVGENSDAIVINATDNNDELPYDQNQYPGGSTNNIQLETQGMKWNQSTTGVNTWSTGPFTAPCGLIRIDFADQAQIAGSGNFNIIELTLVPGNHRGYLAETMEEF